MNACAVPELMAKDPRFQALKEAYKDKHYNDDHIAQALQLYRERTGRDDDWYPESPQYRAAFTRFINGHLQAAKLARTTSDLNQDDVYNMYTTLYSLYTPERLDARVKMIARDFSKLVDQLQERDRTNRSRQELINAQGDDKNNGFKKLMQRVFKIYEDKFTDVDKMMAAFNAKYPNATEAQKANALRAARHRAEEYRTVLANKERLAALAATTVGEEEGFVVSVRNFEFDLSDYNDEENALPDGSVEEGNDDGHDKEEGSKGDRYADFRTLKLMNTLSVRARRLISKIEKVDSAGKSIKDDLGVTQYVGGRQVAVVLKRVLVNSSPETMMSDLQTAAEFYPWLNGLIRELNKNLDARTTIYNNFKSAESTYVYVNLETKKKKVEYGDEMITVWDSNYVPKIANSRAAGHALMREAGSNLQGGYVLDEDNTVYTGHGSLVSLEQIQKAHEKFNVAKKLVQSGEGALWIRMVENDKQATKSIMDVIDAAEAKGKDVKYLLDAPEDAMKTFLDRNPEVVSQITASLRGLGFTVREKDIREIALQKMNKKGFGFIIGFGKRSEVTKGRNKLYQLVEFIDNAFTRAEEIQKKGQEATGQYLYNTSDSFRKINNCLALAQYNDVEARVLNEGKSLSTYNNVNLLHQTFDGLMNRDHRTEEKYQEDLENDFLRYEGMAIGSGDQRQVRGWLQKFRDNEDGIRDKMRIVDLAAFNHVEYAKLSRRQKLTNSIVMYFGGSNTFQADGFAAYEVPIQADYSTAYNFIVAPKLSVGLDQSDVVDALVNEVKMELERISAIEARINDDFRVKLSVYEEQGLKFQIFPEFNDNGFREQYTKLSDKANRALRIGHITGGALGRSLAKEADAFIREQVEDQMTKIVQKDLKTLEDAGVLSNPAMKHIHFGHGNYGSLYAKDGKIANLKEDQLARLNEYCQNVFYARQQTAKLLTGGLEQFNGLIDYEKRNMLSHATHTSLYTEATWKGERVGKESQNVVYIEDDNAQSAFIDDIKEMLDQLKEQKVISANQYNTMISAYSKIKTTDGQGLRTLESYRTVMIMADQWDERHESAYRNIIAGKPTTSDVEVFMQNIKPVLTGYETIPAAAGENQKPVKLTVLHKYSEMVLLPMALSKYCLQNKSVPMQALENAQQQLKKQGKEIDMFLFHSGVKVGAHSILQPFAKDKKTGERNLKTASSIAKYIVDGVNGAASVIHTLPFKFYGIAASTPAHAADDKIAWASQAEKVAWANIEHSDEITVRGEKKNAWDSRELYNKIKTADIIESYTKIRQLFNNTDELEKVFQEELASKSYSSRELQYALSHLKDGTFALPLFSPNVEHQVQELLASIIKKRLTKPKVKGANILQSTGLGMDIEASAFDNTNALSEDEKLRVVFEGSGKNKHIKYVEVYLPLHDSRLKEFADKNGNITYEMLYGRLGSDGQRHNGLIQRGIIPEEILNFIAYRTPSDAEHSVIPCRIKGFIANTAGATIRMPKEIMVMTGHDYDGDKMRCHFADFKVEWDKKLIEDFYNDRLSELQPGEEMPDQLATFDKFFKWFISDRNQEYSKEGYRKVNYEAYDYNKSPLENSQKARANARVELMFSQLTSPAGSRRVLIPGGCDETKVIAKSLYLVRASRDENIQKKIADKLKEQGMEEMLANSVVKKSSSLYDTLVRKDDGQLTDIVRVVSSAEMPYTVTHSADAFDYIMGGSEMIGIYALYNSALQMLQRLDMNYVPKLTEKGKPYEVSILGHQWGRLFEIRNHRGRLASLGLARLLNAAVDNNKDPVLGYLMQTKEMAETTFLMFAAGMTEEEIHLFMNQPAVMELINRLKSSDSKGIFNEARDIITDLAGNNSNLAKIADEKSGAWFALENVSQMNRDDFTKNLSMKYDEIALSEDEDLIGNQIALLQTLLHLQPAANNLADFVRLTRPESDSGAIGTTVSNIITKTIEMRKFREKLALSPDNDIRISGMREVLDRRDVFDGADEKYLEEVIGSKLPEVVALNSLMLDSSLDIFKPFFPTARQSWVNVAEEIASAYTYKKIQEGTVEKIGKEMILWKLLSHPKFIQGDPQVEQKRIIVDVPKNLKDLKQRIGRAEKNPGVDKAADALVGNAFLKNLTTTEPTSTVAPRLQFQLNGPAVEGTADAIRASWGEMLMSSDAGVRQLAIDLFKYNLYTNGFSFGMYEFSHFAPFSVIIQTPGYLDALRDILNSNWDKDDDIENFIHQYYMNHWGDKSFLPKVRVSSLKIAPHPEEIQGQIWLSGKTNERVLTRIAKAKYIVLTGGEEGEQQELYRVIPGNKEAPIILVKAQKLGVHNRNGQVTLQYNPKLNYQYVTPVVPGNDSAWGQLDELNTHAESDYSNPGESPSDDPNYFKGLMKFGKNRGLLGADFFGFKPTVEQLQKVEKQAEAAVAKNDGKLEKVEEKVPAEPAPVEVAAAGGIFGAAPVGVDMSAAAIDLGDEPVDGQMFNIVRRDDDGNVVTDRIPSSPNAIRLARKQKTFVELNKRLREILRDKGVDVGVITNAEARLALGGVTDFDTANVTAEGLLEMIRIAEGYQGEQALPEEFAHVALEMLGHDNILVARLLNALDSSPESMEEAYDGMYSEYEKKYGASNRDKLILEAAGKLVAKHLFLQQEIQSSPVRRLVHRVVDAIKQLLRKFSRNEVQNAIFDANQIASKIAREMLGGRLVDEMSLENIASSGQFLNVQKDLSGKQDILSKLLKTETKRLAIFKKRQGHNTNKQSKAIQATESQIAKLEAAIKNYKTEDAIVSYMSDSLGFLAAMEKSLDDVVNSGRSVNIICKRLNLVRDTLYSFSKSMSDIREAIIDGEVQDSAGLTSIMDQVGGVLEKFFQKYNKLARTYFEEMLSNVYGEHGKTITVGKDKGKVISIKDMARRADHDISLASRWFHSLADCDDYVLKAIDEVTRDAKIRARRIAAAVRPQIEVAISDLEKATGSRDQGFMFERELGEDGKMHRTGKYISEEASKNLTAAQKKFYDTMMAIKKEADKFVPESLVDKDGRKIVMMRKYTMDRFKDAEGAKGKALEAWEGLKNRVMETGDDIDYENYEVAVDFEGNRVDMLPVKFLMKGKKESYDDMSEDVATSMMAYAGMAYEYNELNSVIGILENAKYMSSQRDIVQKTGTRTQRESIVTDDTVFHEPFTVKQAQTNIQKALEDFFQMHIYGHIRKNEGTIGRTKFSKRKVVDTINAVTSYSQMAINIPQRIANVNTGLTQIVLESIGRSGEFSAKDVLWASKIYTKESGDRLAETGKTDYDNKLSLWDEYFDVHQNNGGNDVKYKNGRMSRIFNSSLLYAGLTMGEDYLATTTSLALARNYKVKDAQGNESNLWDAYEVKYTDPVNNRGAYLALKEGYTKLDGSPITFEDERNFSKKIAGMNFQLQGIYNTDDKSAVQQYAFGALLIMYRKWIAPALKRRYADVHYNTLRGDYEEGYHRTLFRLIRQSLVDAKDQVTEEKSAAALLNIIEDMKALRTAIMLNWEKLTPYEKSNVMRAVSELSIVGGLYGTVALLGKIPPVDDDTEAGKILGWWEKTLMSQVLRLRTEIGSQAPTPMLVDEALHILKSPFAAIEPLQNTINAFELLVPSNYMNEIKSGMYRGHKKAYKYFRELPIISMFKKVDNFIDPSPLIQYYKNDAQF